MPLKPPPGPAPLLVGLCPAPKGIPEPLYPRQRNATGFNLFELCRIGMEPEKFTRADYLRTFRRINVSAGFLERARRSYVSDERIEMLWNLFKDPQTHCVVVCGNTAAKILGLGRVPYCVGASGGEFGYSIIPHPSGRNLWYNEPDRRTFVARHLANVIHGWRLRDPKAWDPETRRSAS